MADLWGAGAKENGKRGRESGKVLVAGRRMGRQEEREGRYWLREGEWEERKRVWESIVDGGRTGRKEEEKVGRYR